MPIVRIEALVSGEPDVPALMRRTARAVAEAFDVPEKQCWVTFRSIAPGSYLEGARLRTSDEAAEVSPLVTVSAYHGRSAEQIAAMLRGVARAVGESLFSDPDNVFVEFHEIGEGHVHTGGQVL